MSAKMPREDRRGMKCGPIQPLTCGSWCRKRGGTKRAFIVRAQRADKINGNNRVTFIQGDICKLTDYIPPESADCIGCNAVVDLMCKADRCLFYEKALMVLKPGGTLIVSHVKLAHGHEDWVHAKEEYEMINPFGLLDIECLAATKSLLVVRKG